MKMSDVFDLPVSHTHVDDEVMHELAFGDDRGSNFIIRDCTYWMATTEDHSKHAAHAINCHDELVDALQHCLECIAGTPLALKVGRVLSKARGEK